MTAPHDEDRSYINAATLAELKTLGDLAGSLEPAVRHLAMRAHRVLSEADAQMDAFVGSDDAYGIALQEAGYIALVRAIQNLDRHISAAYDEPSDGRPDWLPQVS